MRYVLLAFLLCAAAHAQSIQLTSFAQPPGGPVEPGATDHRVMQFRLYRDTGVPAADFTGATFLLGAGASVVPADIAAIRLYHDIDSNGAIDPGDSLLASAPTFSSGAVVLGGFSDAIQEGFSNGRDYLLAVDIAAAATPGHTLSWGLTAALVQTSGGSVQGAAVNSHTHTIRVDSGAEIAVFFGTEELFTGIAGATDIGLIPPTGAIITLTIENLGVNPLLLTGTPVVAFSQFTNCNAVLNNSPATSIDPGLNTTVEIDITPNNPAAFSFRIDIPNNDFNEDPFVQFFAGSAAPDPLVQVEYNATVVEKGAFGDIGSHTAGVASLVSFEIHNVGNGDLNLTGTPVIEFITPTRVAASVQTAPALTISPSGSTVVTLELIPVGSGDWNVGVYFESNDMGNNPFTMILEGESPTVTPSELRVFREPADVFAGHVFGTTAIATVTDANGAVDHDNSTVQITAQIKPGTGHPDAQLTGTLTRTAANGYANFSDLEISRTGSNYVLVFTHANGAFPDTETAPFEVAQAPKPPSEDKDDEDEGCSTSEGSGWAWLVAAAAALFVHTRNRSPRGKSGV